MMVATLPVRWTTVAELTPDLRRAYHHGVKAAAPHLRRPGTATVVLRTEDELLVVVTRAKDGLGALAKWRWSGVVLP